MYEGMEARANDVDALLEPGINIHRLPLCGRNFKYVSEDPLLAESIAAVKSGAVDMVDRVQYDKRRVLHGEL